MAAESPLHKKWKQLKSQYDKDLKAHKLNFNKGLGPQLDIMEDPKSDSKKRVAAALKVKQTSIDYRGTKYLGPKSSWNATDHLPKEAFEKFHALLSEIDSAAIRVK